MLLSQLHAITFHQKQACHQQPHADPPTSILPPHSHDSTHSWFLGGVPGLCRGSLQRRFPPADVGLHPSNSSRINTCPHSHTPKHQSSPHSQEITNFLFPGGVSGRRGCSVRRRLPPANVRRPAAAPLPPGQRRGQGARNYTIFNFTPYLYAHPHSHLPPIHTPIHPPSPIRTHSPSKVSREAEKEAEKKWAGGGGFFGTADASKQEARPYPQFNSTL